MKARYVGDKISYKRMTTQELRDNFLLEEIFKPSEIILHYTDVDRAIIGGIVPQKGALSLPQSKALGTDYFTERREIGVINIGGEGVVEVEGEAYDMQRLDSLYIGTENKSISFASKNADKPAQFYLASYPAHKKYPTKKVTQAEANKVELGSKKTANERIIYQSLAPGIVDSCQLVMGFTDLAEGSIWNTMPAHTHERRTEIYMYFDMAEEDFIVHLMGEPSETKSIITRNGQAVLSPSWSIHSGAGSARYTFIWSMGGENQVFDDMDGIDIKTFK